MAQASSPLYPQGDNAENPHAIHPDSVQLNTQVLNHQDEPVVIVQPPVYQSTRTPLPDPVPDYMCYSRFTTLCCCICLGSAALHYSRATRKANGAGQRAEAAENSQTALILNHVGVVVGLICTGLYIYFKIYLEKN
ncbi:hypothetical protein ABG768_009181 [Culter alburnus]|uniref:Synapse differentiation-inducing gene protein 1-like n=1 Tax=Culter alburnus TaxID=194366 RepID=A0AAW1ZLP8_CULAL